MKEKVSYFDTFALRGKDRKKRPIHCINTSMMKNYLRRPIKLLSLLGMIALSAGWNLSNAQNCTIIGPTEACQGDGVTFTVATSPGDVVSWSTTTAGTASGGQANFTFGTPGTETITVNITAAGGGTCTQSINFEVNAKPTANFTLLSQARQCYNGNYFCFKDNSSPGVNRTFVGGNSKAEFLFGDGAQDFTTGPGGTFCHGYPNPAGGCYTPYIRVFNDKGCIDDYTVPGMVCVVPDIGADFRTNATTSCGTTVVPIINTSTVPYNRVKKYYWDFGDGETYTSGVSSAMDSCYWNPTHEYTKHGCFNVRLIIQDDSNCWDTMYKPSFACNVNPDLVIEETNGKDAQCQVGNSFTFTHNIDPLNWPLQFLWVFDDPDSGPQNFDFQRFKGAQHTFTKPDIYTVTITGTIAGCPFFSSIDVLTKGPAATIDAKAIPDIIADSQRHQCQIKDTVYFKNNSAFNFNDSNILNDTATGAASVLKENNMVLLEYNDSVKLQEEVIEVYVWDGDSLAVVELPLTEPANMSAIKHELVMFNNFFGAWGGERQDDHVRTVWDFGDQIAPQCTTWTKFKQNMWDANGKWMNCNFSRDPKPKHWYTPGEEGCYTVTLTMKDTTFQNLPAEQYNYSNGGVFNDTARFVEYMSLDSLFDYPPAFNSNGDTLWNYNTYCPIEKEDYIRDTDPTKRFFTGFDTTYNKWYPNPNKQTGEECEATSTVLLALEPPLAAGMKVRPGKGGQFCLGANPQIGVYFDWSETTPSCTRQFVWMNFDSLADRLDNSPNVLDKWTPQDGFLVNPTTPWPMATMGLPQFPNEIFYDYTGILADSCGNVTVGLRVQNGYDPYTKQPCIDEKWYHNMIKYVNSDPEFTLDTVYGCSPLEVELTFNREFHDSLESLIINVNVDFPANATTALYGYTYIDSVYRDKFDPVTGDTINYVLSFYVDALGNLKKIDSFTWIAGEGGLQGCGSELKIKTKRRLTFVNPARYQINTTAFTTEGCQNTSKTQYAVVGYYKSFKQDKYLMCRDDIVKFEDTALYLLLEPDPLTGAQYVPYNYWRGNNRFQDPDGNPRNPSPFDENTRYDFGQTDTNGVMYGFSTIRFNPIRVSYRVPGHYIVRAEYTDSVGCKDTLYSEVNVTGVKANFGNTVNIGLCKPIVNFFDSSVSYDPCRLLYHYGCDSVIRWIWDFGDGSAIVDTDIDNPVAPPIRNPSHVYDRFGDYTVKLIVQSRMGCWDTLERTISIAGPRPKFDFTIDSMGCVPYTVYLGNFSIDATPGSSWTYHWGDTSSLTTTEDSVVYHTYTKPGKYKLVLIQSDIVPLTGERCSDTFPTNRVIEVTVLPEKKVDFIPSKFEVCPKEIITFQDTSDTTYSTFIWDFGDGTVITLDESQGGRTVTHSYANEGDYVVRLTPDYTPGPGEPKCRQWKSYVIKVRSVNASFIVDTTGMPLFKFTDQSTNAVEHWWRFGDGDNFTKCPQVDPVNCPNAEHNYGDNAGTFDVCLVVKSPEGCYDTACATINNTFRTSIDIPNVFTPNGDGFNDVFKIDIEGWSEYNIKIYNRFSDKVFESDDPNNSWNGKMNNTGADLPAGVYYVIITYKLRGQDEQTYNGTVTLIRP